MESKPEIKKLLHDIESKTAGLKSAAKLLKECSPKEKKELLILMQQSAKDILACLIELEKAWNLYEAK